MTRHGVLSNELNEQVRAAALRLREADRLQTPCSPVRELFPGICDETTAY
jgi:hypothetical protein